GRPRLLTFDLVDPANGDPGVCGGTAEIYLEPHMPNPLLFVVGAGHVGRAVTDLARWLGFRIVVWDDRPEAIAELSASIQSAPGSRTGPDTSIGDPDGSDGAGARPVATATGSIDAAIAEHPIGPDASVVMVTRNVSLDVDLLPPLLASGAGYIGLMGSNRRWTTTRAKLVEAGVEADALDRVVSPIGVEINAETPEEIAVSILAQVVANRRAPGA
ncbi:MAG: XdhC family protein, partial [Actinomycetota bacterium]